MGRHDNSGTRGSRPGASGSGAPRAAARRQFHAQACPETCRQASRKPAQKPARKPVSPVYRRRRLFAGVALLLVIAVAIGGFAAVSSLLNSGQSSSGEGTGTSGQATGPAAGPGPRPPSASPSASPEGNGCEQNLVTVTAATDKPAYAAGENPLLTLKVTNGNRVPCEVNMGTSQMEFLVTSGSDRIFSSTDCQADSTDLVKTIAPGQSETANFPWQRNRTVQGCARSTPSRGRAARTTSSPHGWRTRPAPKPCSSSTNPPG